MARVERFTSEGQIPVQQAQLIDPRSFPADTSSAEALKVGADVANVFAELAIRKRDAQDSLAATKAIRSRTLAELEMQQFMVDNPDPDKWEEGLAKISAKYSANYASLKMSDKTRAKQDIEQQAHNDEMAMRVRLATTNQNIKNDITEAKINLDGLIANDDGSKGDADKIDKALKALEASLLRETTPEIAAEQMEEALRAAKKGYWINQSRRTDEEFDIDKFIAQMQKKKSKIKGGEDKDGLNAKDMDDIIASAITAQVQAKRIIDIENREAKLDLYKKEDEGEALTRDDFNAVYKDPDKADQYYDEYVAGQRAEKNNEANFVKEGNPIVLAKIEAIIDLNPMGITEDELYENATNGIGTKNITRLVDRLRKAKKEIFTSIDKYNTQFSTLLNAGYFGDKDKLETSTIYLEMKRKMKEYLDTQKPAEVAADAFFGGLITKKFGVAGIFSWRGGGWEENGFKHKYINEKGDEVTGFFRFGDIRTRSFADKTIEEFYAGTTDDGEPIWIPRR